MLETPPVIKLKGIKNAAFPNAKIKEPRNKLRLRDIFKTF